MLVNELQDKAAPLYVIALWAHCQQRKSDRFTDLAPNALKAICGYEGEASKLRRALELCEFIEVEGSAIVAHGWAETNAKLVKNWENGGRGGRPRNPTETQPKPNHNPTVTETGFGVTQTEPIEKIDRIEKSNLPPASANGEELPLDPKPIPKPRERNPLFDALARATGSDPGQLTKAAARSCAVALAEIRKACPGLTPDEIQRRAANYRAHFRGAALTPPALAKHWPLCDNQPKPSHEDAKPSPRAFSQTNDYSRIKSTHNR